MQIDTTAMIQGVLDARDADEISSDFCGDICRAISEISYRGPVGRSVCDYDKLLAALAPIEPDNLRLEYRSLLMGHLWRRLGPSLASGLTVAN